MPLVTVSADIDHQMVVTCELLLQQQSTGQASGTLWDDRLTWELAITTPPLPPPASTQTATPGKPALWAAYCCITVAMVGIISLIGFVLPSPDTSRDVMCAKSRWYRCGWHLRGFYGLSCTFLLGANLTPMLLMGSWSTRLMMQLWTDGSYGGASDKQQWMLDTSYSLNALLFRWGRSETEARLPVAASASLIAACCFIVLVVVVVQCLAGRDALQQWIIFWTRPVMICTGASVVLVLLPPVMLSVQQSAHSDMDSAALLTCNYDAFGHCGPVSGFFLFVLVYLALLLPVHMRDWRKETESDAQRRERDKHLPWWRFLLCVSFRKPGYSSSCHADDRRVPVGRIHSFWTTVQLVAVVSVACHWVVQQGPVDADHVTAAVVSSGHDVFAASVGLIVLQCVLILRCGLCYFHALWTDSKGLQEKVSIVWASKCLLFGLAFVYSASAISEMVCGSLLAHDVLTHASDDSSTQSLLRLRVLWQMWLWVLPVLRTVCVLLPLLPCLHRCERYEPDSKARLLPEKELHGVGVQPPRVIKT